MQQVEPLLDNGAPSPVNYTWLARKPDYVTRVVFVRHGRSTYNDEQRFQGRSNRSVLTKLGWETSRLTGKVLRNVPFDAAYTSPLQRVKQTAQAVLSEMECDNLQVNDCSHLLEVNLPVWEGKTYAEVSSKERDLYTLWRNNPQEFAIPIKRLTSTSTDRSLLDASGWPSEASKEFPVRDLYRQAHDFWHHIQSREQGKLILVTAHGGSIRAAISTATGIAPKHYHQLQQSNCGISVVDVVWSKNSIMGWLQCMNQTSHLKETLPKLKSGKSGLRIIAIPSNSDRVHPLHEWLSNIAIHQSWTDTHPSSHQLAQQLCPDLALKDLHQFYRLRSDDIRHILERMNAVDLKFASNQCTTVAAIATPTTLNSLLKAILQFEQSPLLGASGLPPNAAAIVHIPHHVPAPVLQTVGFIPPDP